MERFIVYVNSVDGSITSHVYDVEKDPVAYGMASHFITSENVQIISDDSVTSLLMYDSHCNGYVDFATLDSDDGRAIMARLRRLGFRLCDQCGALITPDEIRSNASVWYREENRRLCPSCQLRHSIEQEHAPTPRKVTIHDYHGTSRSVRVVNGENESFDLDNVQGVGIEMEANGSETRRFLSGGMTCTPEFARIANSRSPRNQVFRVERDCTVAVEIISNVFTPKALRAFDWNILTNQLKLIRNDENVSNVGFHVHLTKTFLGDTPKQQAMNLLKIQYFMLSYKEDFIRLSGRKADEMGWCSFMTERQIENCKTYIEGLADDADDWRAFSCFNIGHGSSGCALISSGKTVELRIGKSTNDAERIAHYLELVLDVFSHIKNVAFGKCYCMNKVFKTVPSSTMNYWRKNGLFLRTNAADVRGIALNA